MSGKPSRDDGHICDQKQHTKHDHEKGDRSLQDFGKRYAGNITEKMNGVVGLYVLSQTLKGIDQKEETGKDQWRFVQTSNTVNQALLSTPGLLNNYGTNTNSKLNSLSTAAFAQADWEFLKGFHVLPGVRVTYDKREADFRRLTYGGL